MTAPARVDERSHAATLDVWIAEHGPLWPASALMMALDLCARASRMPDRVLANAIGSLVISHIVRDASGRWSWHPVAAESPRRTIGDADVIERVGAILFHGLTGVPLTTTFALDHQIRTTLRSLRFDLPPAIADVAVRAVTARRTPALTLAAFARELRQLLGIERHAAVRPRRVAGRFAAAAAATLTLAGVLWLATPAHTERLDANGLTLRETALVDVTEETAEGFAMMDEHTAAIQEYQQIARWWTPRVTSESPVLTWNGAHEAWVRTLAGDRLTTEQMLSGAPNRLAATLGERHPYTRAVRLELAATLEARGSNADAAALRAQAGGATRELLPGLDTAMTGVPAPPGVVAHTAPNAPEREGFRPANGVGFFIPLTSIQRWLAGRDGWRLHLVATGDCRASVVAGNIPRRIAVSVSRAAAAGWTITVDGTQPPVTVHRNAPGTLAMSLIADGKGALETALPGQRARTVIDPSAPAPEPPYSLTFAGAGNGAGCAVVWLEIPFPNQPVS